jgi:hypothetical protein
MSIKSLTDFVNGTGEYDGWADPSTGKPRSKGLFAEYTAEQKAELLKYYHVSEPSFHENTVRNWLLHRLVLLARGESFITCPSPLNVLKDTYDHSCY